MQSTANRQHPPSTSAKKTVLMAALTFVLALLTSLSLSAQTYSVIYNFTGQRDGANPAAGVTLDLGGNLYGTTSAGGSNNCTNNGAVGCGTVFKLSHRGAGWSFSPLYEFTGTPDGANPLARVVFGPNGAPFGTTGNGGALGAGTVFELQPPLHNCPTTFCPWIETQIYTFQGQQGGGYPGGGDLVFDPQGNIYGTTGGGGGYLCDDGPCGTVYELSPNSGSWTAHYFSTNFGGVDCCPYSGLVRGSSGTLFGTNVGIWGGIYAMQNGFATNIEFFSQYPYSLPIGGLILDASGNLYGTTSSAGSGAGGMVFKYVVSDSTLTILYNFVGTGEFEEGPTATLLMDAAGNLYGITHLDGAHRQGSVFKLSQSNGLWTLTTLHDFTGGADGGQPFGQLTMDATGNIYGTAEVGGSSVGNCYQGLGCGVVFEITQ